MQAWAMQDWAVIFAVATGLTAVGFVVVAALWLRALRRVFVATMAGMLHQHGQVLQRLEDTLTRLAPYAAALRDSAAGDDPRNLHPPSSTLH